MRSTEQEAQSISTTQAVGTLTFKVTDPPDQSVKLSYRSQRNLISTRYHIIRTSAQIVAATSDIRLHFLPAFYPHGAANNEIPIRKDIQRTPVTGVHVVLLHFKSVRMDTGLGLALHGQTILLYSRCVSVSSRNLRPQRKLASLRRRHRQGHLVMLNVDGHKR